jgi:ATP-dependent protease Clp ATPase subunit
VKILIAGQEGHICENCVEHAREIIEQELMTKDDRTPSSFKLTVKKPVEIKKFLDEYVIGRMKQKECWLWPFIIIIKDYSKKQVTHQQVTLKLKRVISSWWVKQVLVKHYLQKQLPVVKCSFCDR